jgi:hypothetical protein
VAQTPPNRRHLTVVQEIDDGTLGQLDHSQCAREIAIRRRADSSCHSSLRLTVAEATELSTALADAAAS